jgi:hypothetical protein
LFGQSQRLAAAVVVSAATCQESALFEGGEELRDGRRGNRGAAGELGADDLSLADRLQGEVLSDRQRRIVRGQQPLYPTAHERRRPDERLCRLAAADVMTGPRH